ncbi:MAG: YunC family protein [Thermodesulfobacteriota bacterium]|nr:YunC family protein [Thermodesulfobacteriota bacterium]
MFHEKTQLTNKEADGYVMPLGPVNLVYVITDTGMVGCGAFDVAALDNFGFPAARVRPTRGASIATIEDLLVGEVKDANEAAASLGVKVGMAGREALDYM